MALGVAIVGTLAVGLLQGERPFYGDSGEYWTLSSSFTLHGHFSLLNFANESRGYAFPLVIHVLNIFTNARHSSQSTAATLFNVLVFALIGAILAPQLAGLCWPDGHWSFLRRLAFTTVLLIFWGGNLNYPLTDFPGLAAALLTLVAISRTDKPGWMFLAGVAGGVTLNLRTAYLPLMPMLAVIVALTWFDQRKISHASTTWRAMCLGSLLIGFLAASAPQALSQHRHFGNWSFLPASSQVETAGRLNMGMELQRWDSYERPQGQGALAYGDANSARLLEEQPTRVIESTSQYIGLFVSHPLVMVPLIVQHLLNGLDARYNTIYVEHRDSNGRTWLRLAGFLLVFATLVRLLWPTARRRLGVTRWRYLIALALCCLTPLPTAIETRYLLPLYVITYMVVLAPGWPNPLGARDSGWRRFRTPAVLAITCVAFMTVVWDVVSPVSAHVV
jgi:hypothetical protein